MSPEAADASLPNKRPGRIKKLAFKIGAAAAAGTAVTANIAGQVYAHDPSLGPRIGLQYALGETCAPVSQDQINPILERLKLPPSQSAERLARMGNSQNYEHAMFDYADQQAAANNLHLAGYFPYIEELSQAKSFDQMLKAMNDFMAQYNITFKVPATMGVKDLLMGAEPLDAARFQSNPKQLSSFKTGLARTMEAIAVVPKEVLAYSRLAEVKLTGKISPIIESQGLNAAGQANPLTNIMYIRASLMDADIFIHELGHHLDYQNCGLYGLDHDPGFTSLNPAGFHYGRQTQISMLKYETDVTDDYSFSAPMEDKADDYASFLNGFVPEEVSNEGTVLRDKLVYLLADLNEHVPGIAAYINALTLPDAPMPPAPALDLSNTIASLAIPVPKK
jgi:hypothetical protein